MRKKKSSWSTFGATATIVGFIVDSITLLSILLNFNFGFTTSALANAWMGFLIAILAFVSYTGYLHTFWEGNFEKKHLQARFSSFLWDDLILDFHFPFLLLPPIGLFALLIWLIFIDPFIILPVIIGLFILFFTILFKGLRSKPSYPQATKAIIEKEWEMIQSRIATELQRTTGFVLGIRARDLQDLAVVLDIEPKDMDYALIKFAMLHPEVVEYDFNYGTLYGRVIEALRKRPT